MPNVVVASPAAVAGFPTTNRLSRIFSVRRSGDSSPSGCPPAEAKGGPGMQPLPEEEEAMLGGGGGGGSPTIPPPTLPSPPLLMSPEQTKRRYIVSSLVQSENNYLGGAAMWSWLKKHGGVFYLAAIMD